MSIKNYASFIGKIPFELIYTKIDDKDAKKSMAIGMLSLTTGKEKDENGNDVWKYLNVKFKVFGYAAKRVIDAVAGGNKPTVAMSGYFTQNTYEDDKFSNASGQKKKVVEMVLNSNDAMIIEEVKSDSSNTNSATVTQQPANGFGGGAPGNGFGGGFGAPAGGFGGFGQ